MRLKFNKFERVAGLFMGLALVGMFVIGLSTAIKQGWFESRIYYTTSFVNADGIRQGTLVQISGLRAGAVESVELKSDNSVKVAFYILGKFQSRIRQDSQVQLIRPFVIGDRVLELSVGSEELPMLASHDSIRSIETMDLMSLMSGRNMNSYLGKLGSILDSLQIVLDAFSDKSRAQSVVRIFDRIDPLFQNLNIMSREVITLSRQATHDNGVQKLVKNLTMTTQEMNKILPELNRQNPELAKNLAVMIQDMAVLTGNLAPAMRAVGPELPDASRRLLETLNETVITLKAMQKSFLLENNVQEVKDEEAASKRKPAQAK
jgi:phospholipid/cholesterol/gamma-HCH transport system substrate-binding protein